VLHAWLHTCRAQPAGRQTNRNERSKRADAVKKKMRTLAHN
jgi:hypothetical protein